MICVFFRSTLYLCVLCVSVSPVVVVVCFAAILLTYFSTVLCLSVHVYLSVFMGLVA